MYAQSIDDSTSVSFQVRKELLDVTVAIVLHKPSYLSMCAELKE